MTGAVGTLWEAETPAGGQAYSTCSSQIQGSIKELPAVRGCQRSDGWMELPLQEKGQMDIPSQQLRHSQEPQTLHPRHWQLSNQWLPCAPQACQPTQPSSITFYCLAGKGRLSQLSWPSLSPTGEQPAGANSKSSFLPMGSQAWYSAPCFSQGSPAQLAATAHPSSTRFAVPCPAPAMQPPHH